MLQNKNAVVLPNKRIKAVMTKNTISSTADCFLYIKTSKIIDIHIAIVMFSVINDSVMYTIKVFYC